MNRRDPWPNLFWLVDPRLFQCARALQNLRRRCGGILSSRRGATLGFLLFSTQRGCERRLFTAGGVARRASALEHEGMVQQWQREVCREARGVATSAQFISSEPVHFLQVAAEPQGEFAAALAAAHRE